VFKLDIANGKGTAMRALEGAAEVLEFPLPAVVTVDEGLNKERLPSLKGIMAAKKKPLETRPAQLGTPGLAISKMELPPERGAGRIVGTGKDAVPELVRLLRSEAKAF
jgi:electron transfer flavoprotein beta subunit